jgi:hypothetical protein
MPKDDARPRFSPERRASITKWLRKWLSALNRDPEEAGTLAGELEKVAAGAMLRPGEKKGDDKKLLSPFPLEVCSQARTLERTVQRHEPGPRTLGDLIAGDWRDDFAPREWRTFRAVLSTLAAFATKKARPEEGRLRFLDAKLLAFFEKKDLAWRGQREHKRYAAWVSAETRAHAFGLPVPQRELSRLKRLERAAKKRDEKRRARRLSVRP